MKKNIINVLISIMALFFAPSVFAQINMHEIYSNKDEIHTLIKNTHKTESNKKIPFMNSVDNLRDLYEKNKKINLQAENKQLLLAIKDKDFEKAKVLIKNGADINTSVQFAPIFNLQNDMDVIKFFVEQGAKLNTRTVDEFGSTLLMLTDNVEIASYLLNNDTGNRASLHIEDINGRTALARACYALNHEKVQLFLNSGIKVFDKEKLSLYLYNVISSNTDVSTPEDLLQVVKILLNNDILYTDYDFIKHINLSINFAYKYKQMELFELLYNAKHDYFIKCLSNMPKVYDENNEYIKTVKLLLNQGADPNYNKDGQTPLSITKKKGNKEIYNLLIAYGAFE